jgi:ABC-2 type transport system ATP-binding protein
MNGPIVSLHQVTKRYRRFALDSIDLELRAGSVCGLIGPNGAGKSTLLRILMGLVRPDTGRVEVLGLPMPAAQAAIKRGVGFVSEDMRLHPARTLRWHADLVRGFHAGWDEARAASLAERFELRLDQRAGELSRGQSVKAMLLLALAHRPRLLLLDEPTAGLDPLMRAELLEELERIVRADGLSVLFSSHLTGDVELLADDVAFLYGGRIVETGTREQLVARAATLGRDGPATLATGSALDALFRRRVRAEVARAH